jgi:hypothetical protein
MQSIRSISHRADPKNLRQGEAFGEQVVDNSDPKKL